MHPILRYLCVICCTLCLFVGTARAAADTQEQNPKHKHAAPKKAPAKKSPPKKETKAAAPATKRKPAPPVQSVLTAPSPAHLPVAQVLAKPKPAMTSAGTASVIDKYANAPLTPTASQPTLKTAATVEKIPSPKRKPRVPESAKKVAEEKPAETSKTVAAQSAKEQDTEASADTEQPETLVPANRMAGVHTRKPAANSAPTVATSRRPVLKDGKEDDTNGMPETVVVFFKDNSPDMEGGQDDIINRDVVSVLENNPELRVEIRAFADGDDAQALSKRRASILQTYLRRKDIDTDRISLSAEGDDTRIQPRDRAEFYFGRM